MKNKKALTNMLFLLPSLSGVLFFLHGSVCRRDKKKLL